MSAAEPTVAAVPLLLRRALAERRRAGAPLEVVVLAAGLGSRLGGALPKPLTVLGDGRSILQRQLDGLREVLGPAVPVTAVVGHRAEEVVRAAPGLSFTRNPAYATTNTARSLELGLRSTGPGGVLWLNGDVVFETSVLEALAAVLVADTSAVVVDTATVADEEVKYTLDADGCIAGLSKTVTGGLGEAVGINYVSAADKPVLVEHLAACSDNDYFERGMETAIADRGLRFRPVDVTGLTAVEVDFAADLERANALLGGEPAADDEAEAGSVSGQG